MDDIDADMLPEDQDLTGIPEEGHNSDLDGDGEGDGEGEGSVGMNMSMIMNSGSSSSSIVRSTRSPMSNNSKKNKNKYKKQFAFCDNVGLSYEDYCDLTLTTTDLNTPNADLSSHQPINNRYPSNNINKSKIMSLQDPSLIPYTAVTRSRSKSLSQPSVTTRSPRSDDDTIITTTPPPPPLSSLLPSLPPSLQLPQPPQEQTSTTNETSTLQESKLALSVPASKDILPPTTSQQTRKNRRHSEPFADRISSSAEFTTLIDINSINNNTATLTRTRMPSSGDEDTSNNSPPHIRRRSAHITSASCDSIVDLHTRTILSQNTLETTTPYTQLKRSKSERKSGSGPGLSTHAKADRVTKQASKKMRSIGASLWPSMRNQVCFILHLLCAYYARHFHTLDTNIYMTYCIRMCIGIFGHGCE